MLNIKTKETETVYKTIEIDINLCVIGQTQFKPTWLIDKSEQSNSVCGK